MRQPALETSAPDGTEQLGSMLVAEMRQRWGNGERPSAEDLFSRHPELWQRPQVAVDLIYEEFCQREAAGQEGVREDIFRRFPQWAGPLRVMLDCHQSLLQLDRDRPRFPACGELVGEFRLVRELARGSRGRVFLATQVALGDRQVVLKIAPLDGREHLSLARLQHTNIVPLYSVLDDSARNIRILCMPYFGRATLSSLLESLTQTPLSQRMGKHVVAAIDGVQEPSAPAVASAARQMLECVSFEQAMCWITASLADALQFAHERGIVHLDLKPSNVLLASDGQPMLLDFHLAREPIRPNGPLPDNFGGTLPYMPDEQRAAMQSLQNGQPVNVTVDGRADIYALGAMLYEALGGRLATSDDSPPLSRLNPQVSTGLSDVVARAMARAPEERYGAAGELADDLRRHLTDQVLLGVPNRDFAERWQKWRRRRPNRLRAVAMVVLIAGAAAILAAGKLAHWREERQQAELALRDGQRQLQSDQNVTEAAQTFERGLSLAKKLPFRGGLERELREQLATAKRLSLAQQIHHLADEIRVLYGADFIPPAQLRALASQSEAFWEKRDVVVDLLGAARNAELTDDLMDVAVFAAELQIRLSGDRSFAQGRQHALKLLDEAEAVFGANAVLEHERRINRAAAGLPTASVPLMPARTAWEHYAIGRAFLGSGDLPRARQELAAALELEPAGRWPNFYYGVCAYRMGRYEEAIAAFSVCIGSGPKVAGYFYNRALSHAALGHAEQALHDYDRALQIDPAHAASALNRGVLHLQQSHLELAIADLDVALRCGANPATVHYDLALVHRAAGDNPGAMQEARHALEHDPTHEAARRLLDTLQQNISKSDAAFGR